jgi:HK97 gp10 family phage protein
LRGACSLKTSLTITGLDKLDAKLKQLGSDVARKIVVDALKAGAAPILAAAKSNVNDNSGLLSSSLKIETIVSPSKGFAIARVGTKEGDYKGETFYGAFLEWGHKRGKRPGKSQPDSRETVAPKPFLRPAFDENKDAALSLITETLKAGIEQAARGGA